MAKAKARYGGSGRVTPKKDEVVEEATETGEDRMATLRRSARYTPPSHNERAFVETPKWVPIMMWSMLALGVLMILLSYFGVLPGGDQAINYWIVGGLGCITAGFIIGTRLH